MLRQFTVLLVEDDQKLLANMEKSLAMIFRQVHTASDGVEAFRRYSQNRPDFILSDISMPVENGLTLIERVRQIDTRTAVIIISAFSNEGYLLKSANLQIDGYIIKPVSLDKLLPTLEKATKRMTSGYNQKSLVNIYQNYFFDLNENQLFHGDRNIRIGRKESKLFSLLCTPPGRLVTRDEISKKVWGHQVMTDSALKNLLSSCRKKTDKEVILNVSGRGWKLKEPK